MKGIIIAGILVLVITGLWYNGVVNDQKIMLQQSRERLALANQDIESGKLKAANSLLIQSEIDLKGINGFFILPFIKKQKEDLLTQHHIIQNRFDERLALIQDILNDIMNSLKGGQFNDALNKANAALHETLKDDINLNATSRYLNRLNVQDFRGAEEILPEITVNLPEETNVDQIAGMLSNITYQERETNRKSQAIMASKVRYLADPVNASISDDFEPVLYGRAMVWDFTKNEVDPAYEMLPDDLRASSRDGIVTMFCIVDREDIEVGRYSVSNSPAYQEKMTLSVVYWPEKVSPGTVIVWGERPPSSRTVSYSPEYGSSVNIKKPSCLIRHP